MYFGRGPRSHFAATLCAIVIASGNLLPRATSAAVVRQAAPQRTPIVVPAPGDTALAVHVLNRLAFGPRPGDVGLILNVGINRWIEQQLQPDSALDKTAREALAGCDVWTSPVQAAVARLSGRETFAMVDSSGATRTAGIRYGGVSVVTRDSAQKIRGSPILGLYLANGQLHGCRLTRSETSDWQLLEVMTDFWENHFSLHGFKLPLRGTFVEYDRAVIRPNALGNFRKLLGDVAHSPAMLAYLDNAVNSADSGRATLLPYRMPTLPNISVTPNFGPAYVRPGLNENYARELLELHTMGADAGYTQADVINVARALTGWSHTGIVPGGSEIVNMLSMSMIPGPRSTIPSLAFVFDSSRHDAESKVVLGRTLPAQRGTEDGEDVLDIIARHPSTARFIARKLAVRFVSDTPPDALIERAAATFTRTNGDIREVLRTILTSAEFLSPNVFGAKVKSPVEFVLSMRRALSAPVDVEAELVDLLVNLDQPPTGRFSPDGWPETGSAWMTVGAMSTRIDIVNKVARDSLASIPVSRWSEWKSLSHQTFDVQLAGVMKTLLNGRASQNTRATLAALRPPAGASISSDSRELILRELIALALSSPEFQRR